MREDRDSLVERLHRQTAEYSAFKLENERLKVWMHAGSCEAKGRLASVGADEPGVLRVFWSQSSGLSPTAAPTRGDM